MPCVISPGFTCSHHPGRDLHSQYVADTYQPNTNMWSRSTLAVQHMMQQGSE